MFITKVFKFDSAHKLPNYDGKCANLHGHCWKLEITVEGFKLNNGMMVDFNIIKGIVEKSIIEKLDHNYINDIIPNPTAENIVIWIWERLYKILHYKLFKVKLYETETNFVAYYGEKILKDEVETEIEATEEMNVDNDGEYIKKPKFKTYLKKLTKATNLPIPKGGELVK